MAAKKKLKLHQAVSVLDGEKTRYSNDLAVLDKQVQRSDPFTGLARTYVPFNDGPGEQMPPESKKVAFRAEDLFVDFRSRLVTLFDSVATHEWGNAQGNAKADVKVGDRPILKDVPVTFLLFLEKKLVELASVVRTTPVTSPDQEWQWDGNTRLWRSAETQKVRTRKKKIALTLVEPTEHHPGQAVPFDEDVPVGTWTETQLSGALSEERKKELLDRFEVLIRAVRLAREEANSVEIEEQAVGAEVFDFLFHA